MNSYDDFYNSICRVCLSYKSCESMVCLTNKSNEDGLSYYGEAVEMFAKISIKINDELPNFMCQSCLYLLKQAIKFKLMCESSNKKLLNLFNQHKNSNSNLKEIVVRLSSNKGNCPKALYNVTSSSSSKDESKDISNEKIKDIDTDSEKSSHEIDRETEQTQRETNGCDSADEMLDYLEEKVLGVSRSPYTMLTAGTNYSLVRKKCTRAVGDVTSSIRTEVECTDISNEKVEENVMDGEESSQEIENETEQTQRKTDGYDSADEVLDHLENMVLGVSKSKNKLMKTAQVRKRFQSKRNVTDKKMLQQNKQFKAKLKNTYVCKVCNKVLANKHIYKDHMIQHKDFSFICEHCGEGFAMLWTLNTHQLTSHGTGLYFFQCPHCPFKAPRQLLLTEHIRLHTGERPYTCDKCGLTFRRQAIWKKHMIYHKEKTKQCPDCPKKFHTISDMQAHSNGVHKRMYVYLCQKCNSTYAKTGTVRKHLTEIHGIPREMQGKILRIYKGKGVDIPNQ